MDAEILGAHGLDLFLGFAGGVILSLATSFHLLLKGRVTGSSGCIHSITCRSKESRHWKLSLFSGTVLIGCVIWTFFGYDSIYTFQNQDIYLIEKEELQNLGLSSLGFGITGTLIGIGVKLCGDCSMGHAICGVPRFERRSIIVCLIMTASAIGIATLKYYIGGFGEYLDGTKYNIINSQSDYTKISTLIGMGMSLLIFLSMMIYRTGPVLVAFIVGILLGLGILISGFAKRRTIVGFFTFNADWNPTLIVIFGTAISLNFLFNKCIIFKRKRPIYNSKFELMHFRVIDKKLVFGSIFYGLGYGLSGLTPTASFTILFIYEAQHLMIFVLFILISHVVTSYVVSKYFSNRQLSDLLLDDDDQRDQSNSEDNQNLADLLNNTYDDIISQSQDGLSLQPLGQSNGNEVSKLGALRFTQNNGDRRPSRQKTQGGSSMKSSQNKQQF